MSWSFGESEDQRGWRVGREGHLSRIDSNREHAFQVHREGSRAPLCARAQSCPLRQGIFGLLKAVLGTAQTRKAFLMQGCCGWSSEFDR